MSRKKIFFPIFFVSVVIAIVIFLFFFFSFCSYGEKNTDRGEMVISTKQGENLLTVEIADTPAKRASGLMWRSYLSEGEGMLFVFGDEGKRNFWMKNTLIPLDIIFISASKKIIGITSNAKPCEADMNCSYITSEENAKYVLEVNGGDTETLGIQVGDSVQFDYPFKDFWFSCGSRYFY